MAQVVVDRAGFAVSALADACAVLVEAPVGALSSAEVAAGLVEVQRATRLLDATRVRLVGEAAPTGAALGGAVIGIEHAGAIVTTLERLPGGLDPATRAAAQTQLLAWAGQYDARNVARLGRHLNHVVDPDAGEASPPPRRARSRPANSPSAPTATATSTARSASTPSPAPH